MSVLAMSTDVQDRDIAGRKRSHGDFLDHEVCGTLAFKGSEHIKVDISLSDKENDVPCLTAPASPSTRSSTCLSEPPGSPVDRNLSDLNPASQPLLQSTPSSRAKDTAKKPADEPPKKKRLTAEEKAARDAAMEAEKRKRQEEREKKRREKEEAEKLKAEQRAARAADKAGKEQEKKQRAEEREKRKREKEEEEAKKARSQMKLTSMFNVAPAASRKESAPCKPQEVVAAPGTRNREAEEPSLYERMFKPFYVKEHVHLASDRCQLDEETRVAKTMILDEYLSGRREPPPPVFDPLEALQIPCKVRRGRVYPSVKEIMEEFDRLSSGAPKDVTTESQGAKIRHALEGLKSVPVKSIKFKEDVRPPYIGTVSGLPPGGKSLRKLARNPVSRNILTLNYDYDSEAEWQDEEGEDVDDLDDEEEDGDADEDMADFLDDSEDAGPARMGFVTSLEPESIGPSWEDRKRRTAELKLYKYRLEYILEPLERHHSIDPFSSAYWETPKSKVTAGNDVSTAPTSTSVTNTSRTVASTSDAITSSMTPAAAQSDAFQALNPTSAASAGANAPKRSQQPLPVEMQEKLKDLVRSMPTLSKVGVIELFAAQNPGCHKAQIKTSFDTLFEKAGKVFRVRGE